MTDGGGPDAGAPVPHPKSRGAARRARRTNPTLEDVAAVAGVSRGTVSRLLNGGTYVSVEARQAIERAIQQTGYVVNRHARSLVTGRTGYVAFVLSESQERLFTDPNISTLLRSASQALTKRGLALVLMVAATDDERRHAVDFLRAGHVDGALVVSAHGPDLILRAAAEGPLPVVVCGRPLGFEETLPWVGADDREGARQVTRYLTERGHRRIATITGPLDTPGGVDRLAGYRDVLGESYSEELVAVGDYSQASGVAAMTELLDRRPDLDAVFAASDLMAAGALATLAATGRNVPADVAVAGFDDGSVAAVTSPALTTVRHPLDQVAATMVEILVGRIDGEDPRSPVVFPTEVVRRASA
jgi:DNA-binding LacI/PurR family transcriptional regulator